MVTARDIMRDGLPIKCIEACFLGIYLTCGYPNWKRYPVGFKTKVDGQKNAYRYILSAWLALLLSAFALLDHFSI